MEFLLSILIISNLNYQVVQSLDLPMDPKAKIGCKINFPILRAPILAKKQIKCASNITI